jgi:hypothetical protein
LIDAKQFAQVGYKYLGTPYKQMDCQTFVERCMADCGLKKDLRGSNAWYREMDWVGTPEECKKIYGSIPTGATLFIWSDDGGEIQRGYKDGKGNASHIGIVTHTGKGAIHSSSSRGCVAESGFTDRTVRNGGWNRIGLSRLFDYGDKINTALSGDKADEVIINMEYAQVITENGLPVKLRPTKSTSRPWLTQIPNGTQLLITERDGMWAKTTYDGCEGYVMEAFLAFDGAAVGSVSISLERGHAEALLAALKKALGVESNV